MFTIVYDDDDDDDDGDGDGVLGTITKSVNIVVYGDN